MQNQPKLFAFKLAEKKISTPPTPPTEWKVRVGVAIAGCSEVDRFQYRYSSTINSRDTGQFC
ncbi:hypothetical protein [Janthinobacterium lividum]|uniref:hypothetical protein n=1 Tax=Janthinobacterium lividum TaxID=29581 RepID=UPI0014087D9C|nr:hypothetical protein [Janthinobacterium lividum]NHQ90825.1 hypothetical protein [Janthinobacterium lividum]